MFFVAGTQESAALRAHQSQDVGAGAGRYSCIKVAPARGRWHWGQEASSLSGRGTSALTLSSLAMPRDAEMTPDEAPSPDYRRPQLRRVQGNRILPVRLREEPSARLRALQLRRFRRPFKSMGRRRFRGENGDPAPMGRHAQSFGSGIRGGATVART